MTALLENPGVDAIAKAVLMLKLRGCPTIHIHASFVSLRVGINITNTYKTCTATISLEEMRSLTMSADSDEGFMYELSELIRAKFEANETYRKHFRP